jgi:hypothetical protein
MKRPSLPPGASPSPPKKVATPLIAISPATLSKARHQKKQWQLALEKRGARQKRLVEIAMTRLVGSPHRVSELPVHHVLGIHLGLLALANSSPQLVDVRARARWIIHWLFGYMFDQGFTVEDAASDNGLLALEAIATVASTAKEARESQPKAVNNILFMRTENGNVPIDQSWQDVYMSAWKFVNALGELAR